MTSNLDQDYHFSFGPWNLHPGEDPFGPAVRPAKSLEEKLDVYKELGFSAVQLHDDDVVPDLDSKPWQQVKQQVEAVRSLLDNHGLVAEFVAPRLWEDDRGVDGGFTANDSSHRKWAIERSKKAIDIAELMGTDLLVLWLAREGTYIREAKCSQRAYDQLLSGIDSLLEYSREIRVAIEPKPNEPVDHAFIPTMGHSLALASQTLDPTRVGGLIETAHAQLAGLDPSDEMAFALHMKKLWSVHLNDQNGLKYDQDKSFGSVNLRAAFNQVRVLEKSRYFDSGYYVGLDVKAMRTQKDGVAWKHLANSKDTFLMLVEKSRSFPEQVGDEMIAARDYEALERLVTFHLMGVPEAANTAMENTHAEFAR